MMVNQDQVFSVDLAKNRKLSYNNDLKKPLSKCLCPLKGYHCKPLPYNFIMKKTTLLAALLIIATCLCAQNYKLTVGEEMKLTKGTTDMEIVAADKTGVYFTEAHFVMKAYFVIGATYGTSQKLIKFDKNFNETYTKEYKKELKGYNFHSFQTVGDELFMFATDYIKKERTFKVLGARIDKSTGELFSELAEIASFELETKKDDYELRVESVNNGKNLLAVVNISNTDRTTLGVSLLDTKLKQRESTIINLTYPAKHYTIQDVKYTASKKIVLLGKEFEEVESGKRKKKKLVFTNYSIAVYNNRGKKERDIASTQQNRFVIGGKLIEEPTGELLLAGFYSNTAKKEEMNGFFVNKMDVLKGELLADSYKEIYPEMLGTFVEDDDKGEDTDDKKNKEKRSDKEKENDDEDAFPNTYVIRSVAVNPVDGSYVITAEISQYSFYSYQTSEYNSMSKTWTYRNNIIHRFTNSNILVINTDVNAKIKWMNSIPKKQVEQVSSSSATAAYVYYQSLSSYFAQAGGMPYYSSYSSLIDKNNLIVILNDHKDNNVTANYNDKVKTLYNFKKKSNTYGIAIDLATGKMSRKYITANNEDLIMMPRHGYVVSNEIYIPTWRQHMLGKTEFKMTKIAVN